MVLSLWWRRLWRWRRSEPTTRHPLSSLFIFLFFFLVIFVLSLFLFFSSVYFRFFYFIFFLVAAAVIMCYSQTEALPTRHPSPYLSSLFFYFLF